MGLNHMNGRVQDATTGRFLSPDPVIQDSSSSQDYNRYTYVMNNPLTYIDPSGFDTTLTCPDCAGGGGQAPDAPNLPEITVSGSPDPSPPPEPNFQSPTPPSGIPDAAALPQVTVKATKSSSTVQPQTKPTNCPSAQSIDDYLSSKNSPMVGQGANFMSSGQQYNLDPRLLVAIAGAETSFGNNITAGAYNALNVMYNRTNPYDSPFVSFQSNINSAAYSITNPRNGYDLTNTATMYGTYCSGAGCSAGLQNLNTFMHQQEADTSALNYPSNCE
jgi:hypothetical protein